MVVVCVVGDGRRRGQEDEEKSSPGRRGTHQPYGRRESKILLNEIRRKGGREYKS